MATTFFTCTILISAGRRFKQRPTARTATLRNYLRLGIAHELSSVTGRLDLRLLRFAFDFLRASIACCASAEPS